jgi:excisionase family DNA binding protein
MATKNESADNGGMNLVMITAAAGVEMYRRMLSGAPDGLTKAQYDQLARLFRERKWMNLDEAADYISVSPQHLSSEVKAGKLKSSKVGMKRRFHVDDLDAYVRAGAVAR